MLIELKDINKFTGFKDGAFKYELGKYQASLLLDYVNNLKQSLNEIKEIIQQSKGMNFQKEKSILQIIDKVLGSDE